MPLHPDDLQNFADASGGKPFPAGFEQEYEHQLALKHRMKSPGPLGVLMVGLMRQFGILPPAPAPMGGNNVAWRTLEPGTRIKVKMDGGGVVRGRLVGMGEHSMLLVKLPGTEWTQEFPPVRVELDSDPEHIEQSHLPPMRQIPSRAPHVQDLLAPQASTASGRLAVGAPEGSNLGSQSDLPTLQDGEVAYQRAPVKMGSPWWHSMKPGKAIKITGDGEVFGAVFKGIGPSDGQFKAVRDGDDMIDVFEESQYVPTEKPGRPKQAGKKGSGKKSSTKKPASQKPAASLADPVATEPAADAIAEPEPELAAV